MTPLSPEPGVTYDAGLLVAAAGGNRLAWALHDELLAARHLPRVPTVVVAQAWRPGRGQAALARLLKGCTEDPLDPGAARDVGRFATTTKHADVADLVVAEGAVRRGDRVVTSDPDDMVRCGVPPRRVIRV